jgi:hypothetical protein
VRDGLQGLYPLSLVTGSIKPWPDVRNLSSRTPRRVALIHRGAWKGFSTKLDFRFTAFCEAHLRSSHLAHAPATSCLVPWRRCATRRGRAPAGRLRPFARLARICAVRRRRRSPGSPTVVGSRPRCTAKFLAARPLSRTAKDVPFGGCVWVWRRLSSAYPGGEAGRSPVR